MPTYKITLKADCKLGTFYWVANVKAESEEEAATSAEHLFLEQINSGSEWDFSDYDAEKL